jgi:ERCC4-type nuclease
MALKCPKIYVIEGQEAQLVRVLGYKVWNGVCTSLLIRDGISIYRSMNPDQTLEFLFSSYNKLSDPKFVSSTPENYASTCQVRKKDNYDAYNVYLMQLMQIPGISAKIATRMAAKVPTLSNLFALWSGSELTETQKEQLFADINTFSDDSKVIRLGKKRSRKVYQLMYLHQTPSETESTRKKQKIG